MTQSKTDIGDWGDTRVEPGQSAAVHILVSQSYAGTDIKIPVYVWRAKKPGPTVAVTAAVHGDEINGTGAIRHMIVEQPFKLTAGTLVFVPVVNILGFERHSRYLPDRRDLNRSFPGTKDGSLASRLARAVFDQVIKRCDYCIDLHTAAIRRTNFPNVRADMTNDRLADFSRAFGTELIISSQGPVGSLRRSANKYGCTTLILEAGEVWKIEPAVVEYAVRGISNCLMHLKMIKGKPKPPAYQIIASKTSWVRAVNGGLLSFHISPGDIIRKGEPIATNTSLLGIEHNTIESPLDGIVLGMTTMPSVAPGDPICHIARIDKKTLRSAEQARDAMSDESLHQRVQDDLATSLMVSDADEPEQ